MIKTLILLTLSEKFGKYCVLGYCYKDDKIYRLVSDAKTGAGIDKSRFEDIEILDEVNVKFIEECSSKHQVENVLIMSHYGVYPSGRSFSPSILEEFATEEPNIFGCSNYKIADATTLGRSVEIRKVKNLKVTLSGNEGGKKHKVNFECGGTKHEFYSMTDPRYYGAEDEGIIENAYIIVSLPAEDDFSKEKGYYKFVSAILEI